MRLGRRALLALCALCSLIGGQAPAHAEGGAEELRLKLKLDGTWGHLGAQPLHAFTQVEQRYRDAGLVLQKSLAGVGGPLRSWLGAAVYYARVDGVRGASHKGKHMVVLELKLKTKLGPVGIVDRHGGEWHSEPGFLRYRNRLVVSTSLRVPWLKLWVGDELRVDSDEGRVVMNDLLAGLDLKLSPALTLRIYYDRESNRRGADAWTDTDALQLQLIAHLGH